MARKQHLALLAASLVSLGACTSKPPALEQSVLTSSADVALIIANQIENSQLIENAQVSSVNPNIKNWYLSEQFFGGMHGSGDLQKPSVYGKSICEAQGGNLQHTKRGSSPSASGYGRAAEPWTYPSLRENFGSFVCFKNGRADWKLEVTSSRTAPIEQNQFSDPQYRTNLIFYTSSIRDDINYKSVHERVVSREENRPQSPSKEQLQRAENLNIGTKVCRNNNILGHIIDVGYVQEAIGNQVIVFNLIKVNAGIRDRDNPHYTSGNFWDFYSCDYKINIDLFGG